MDNDSYLLLLLSDGNLPTGSFVSSSGLESYFKHGFPLVTPSIVSPASARVPSNIQAILDFIRESLSAYARMALPFASAAHEMTESTIKLSETVALSKLKGLDTQYETMTLNHITRRASKAQGVALLTLFSKGFSRPNWLDSLGAGFLTTPVEVSVQPNQTGRYEGLVDAFKLSIRKGETAGHLPICWGVLTGGLLLSKERSQQIFLFLYSRSLLSAAIRLNTIGPYAAQQLLLHVIRQMVDEEAKKCAHLQVPPPASSQGEDWERWERDDIPATTWPLGEILSARHDLQHSRIFNS